MMLAAIAVISRVLEHHVLRFQISLRMQILVFYYCLSLEGDVATQGCATQLKRTDHNSPG